MLHRCWRSSTEQICPTLRLRPKCGSPKTLTYLADVQLRPVCASVVDLVRACPRLRSGLTSRARFLLRARLSFTWPRSWSAPGAFIPEVTVGALSSSAPLTVNQQVTSRCRCTPRSNSVAVSVIGSCAGSTAVTSGSCSHVAFSDIGPCSDKAASKLTSGSARAALAIGPWEAVAA